MDHTVIQKLAYLAGFSPSTEINRSNLSLQGSIANILTAQDEAASFFGTFQRKVKAGDASLWL
jgi:hypothetical protein